jgi:structural maintenance of chromosome 2
MFIKEIVIEGFKSYAQRTVITGFDSSFNAITGLNGSGKSNILDAICFVLGLTSLSHARVSSLQELIYKFGHAGITKAIVTLILDNSNKAHCVPGYEQFKIMTVARQVISRLLRLNT